MKWQGMITTTVVVTGVPVQYKFQGFSRLTIFITARAQLT
jgi:hypothetical protein